MKHANVLNGLKIEKKQELSYLNYSTKNFIVPTFPILKGTGQGHGFHLVDSSP